MSKHDRNFPRLVRIHTLLIFENDLSRPWIERTDVRRVYESIPARRYRFEASRVSSEETRAALGIPPGTSVIAGGGTLQRRKGPGRQLANSVREHLFT